MLGFLLPTSTYACGIKTEKTSKTEKKDCCSDKHSKNNDKHCSGKCGHSNCTTSSVAFSIILQNEILFKNNNLDFFNEKSRFYNSKTFISSGFSSIWIIPKIS